MIFDFRKNKKLPKKLIINNRNVEIVENFKYLGILSDNTFSFDLQVQTQGLMTMKTILTLYANQLSGAMKIISLLMSQR